MAIESSAEQKIIRSREATFRIRGKKNIDISSGERPEWMDSTIPDGNGNEIPIGEWLSKNYSLRGGGT